MITLLRGLALASVCLATSSALHYRSTSSEQHQHVQSSLIDELIRIIPKDVLILDGVPCVSIALMEDGHISSRVITNGAENEDTIFQAASISKSMTALAVAVLIDQKKLTYDSKIAPLLPASIKDCLAGPATAHLLTNITVAMLLSHTAGLSQGGFEGYPGQAASVEDIVCGRFPSNSPSIRLVSFPGAQYSYSGGGYVLLQLVMENVMQSPFQDIMQDLVLRPLGMSRSHFGKISKYENNYAKAHYTAYTSTEQAYHTFPEMAAAGLWTTPRDLMLAMRAIHESLHTSRGLIRSETARTILTHTAQSAGSRNYALGWDSDEHIFGHSGSNSPGFQSYYFATHGGVVNQGNTSTSPFPRGHGLAVMTNTYGYESIRKIVNALYFLKRWPRLESSPSNIGAGQIIPYEIPEGSLNSAEWQAWLGLWDQRWQIADQDGPILVDLSQASARLLLAATPSRKYDGIKREFNFVAEGLRVAVSLTWRNDDRVIELIQGSVTTVLTRQAQGQYLTNDRE